MNKLEAAVKSLHAVQDQLQAMCKENSEMYDKTVVNLLAVKIALNNLTNDLRS